MLGHSIVPQHFMEAEVSIPNYRQTHGPEILEAMFSIWSAMRLCTEGYWIAISQSVNQSVSQSVK
jgi:hypothetical protein